LSPAVTPDAKREHKATMTEVLIMKSFLLCRLNAHANGRRYAVPFSVLLALEYLLLPFANDVV